MNFSGLIIGAITFLLIGLFHPIVIKSEYFLGTKSWVLFLISGILFALMSIFVQHTYGSLISGILSCCCFWSIKEVFEQEIRVLKGWFPMNPERSSYYEKIQDKLKKQEEKFTH